MYNLTWARNKKELRDDLQDFPEQFKEIIRNYDKIKTIIHSQNWFGDKKARKSIRKQLNALLDEIKVTWDIDGANIAIDFNLEYYDPEKDWCLDTLKWLLA